MLRGVFLTSTQPARTAAFYRDVAGVALDEVGDPGSYVYWKVDDGRMQLAIHDAKAFADYSFPPVAKSNLAHLYFQIPDQASFLERLRGCGITPHSVDDVVVTVVDPDGRWVMFGTA
jgi:hypothetical protein